jgi:hypothetical protein
VVAGWALSLDSFMPTPKTAGHATTVQQAVDEALKVGPSPIAGLGAAFTADPAVWLPGVLGAISSLLRAPGTAVQMQLQPARGPGQVAQLRLSGSSQVELTVLGGTGRFEGTLEALADIAAASLQEWRAAALKRTATPVAQAAISALLAGLDGFERLKVELRRFKGHALTPRPVLGETTDELRRDPLALCRAVTGHRLPVPGDETLAPKGEHVLGSPAAPKIATSSDWSGVRLLLALLHAVAQTNETVLYVAISGQRLHCVRGSSQRRTEFEDSLLPSPYGEFGFNPCAIHERLKLMTEYDPVFSGSYRYTDGRFADL